MFSIIALSVLVSACTRAAPTVLPAADAMTQAGIQPPPTAILVLPTNTPVQPATAVPTDTPEPVTESTAGPAPATETLAPIITPTSQFTPTATSPPFDPDEAYGEPDIVFPGLGGWTEFTGALPDTEFIKMEVKSGDLYITGKYTLFDTWWFSWPNLSNFYVEMEAQSTECAGIDAYGLIFFGPPSGEPAHGYITSFSCDGAYSLRRMDNPSPNYQGQDLIGWTDNSSINVGMNIPNKLGILNQGDTKTIYANGNQIAVYVDSAYSSGRIGVFVSSFQTQDYTFRVKQIRIWQIN